jgi:catechol 2,3-dioxygenase-like lactoylglutathione lyase family enzyme
MNGGMNTVLYPVSDLAKARALFTRLLGTGPVADAPYYVGFQSGDVQIGLVPNGEERGMTGATPFWDVDDIRGMVAALVEAGATIAEDVNDVGGGLLVAMVFDEDGNMIGLRQQP